MEATLPRIFRGAVTLFNEGMNKNDQKNEKKTQSQLTQTTEYMVKFSHFVLEEQMDESVSIWVPKRLIYRLITCTAKRPASNI